MGEFLGLAECNHVGNFNESVAREEYELLTLGCSLTKNGQNWDVVQMG